MKRQGNLFGRITDIDNIYLAHQNAKKGKSYYSEVRMVENDKAKYLGIVRDILVEKKFHTALYKTKTIFDSGKMREIFKLPYFPDRIVHHAIMNILQPIWDKTFIYDCYSAVPGKGIHAGVNRLHRFMKDIENTQYCLKFDIRHYYPSVRHDKLIELIKKDIKCKDTLWLLEDIILSAGGNTNIPIGNYLSQYFANIYLSGLDHWLKEEKRLKYYIRYSDDGVILHKDKKFLQELLKEITDYLGNLSLQLNPKTQIFPVDKRGIDFLGYRSFRDYTLMRKSSAKTLKKKIRIIEAHYQEMDPLHVISSVMSYMGWIKHCDGHNLVEKHIMGNERLLLAMDRSSERLGIKNPLWKV
jgi:retron-type reverse transcriptase